MSEEPYNFGRCGVFCEMCPTGNGLIKAHADELLRLIKNAYSWAEDNVDFSFHDVREGLKWISGQSCPGCTSITEPWCDVLKCEKFTEMKSCLQCDEIISCSRMSYQRDRYPFVLEHHKFVKENGLQEHFKEERRKSKEGITLIDIRKW